jgi:protein O-mannosyl-transferase
LRIPAAWLAAMIFAVHPVCVGSVAWIAELKNMLSLPFFLLSFLWYLRLDSEPGTSHFASRTSVCYCVSLLAFALALLSKTSTVMLPVVLLGCAWWQRGSITRRDWLRTAPFFVLALAFGVMSIWFQAHGAITGATVQSENFWGRLAGAGMALWFYLGKALLPLNLCMIYPRWKIDAAAAWSYLPLFLWCGLLAGCWWLSRFCPVASRAEEPQSGEERGEGSGGGKVQSNHLSVPDSPAVSTGPSLRPSRLCGLTGHSSTSSLPLRQTYFRNLLFGLGCFTITLFPVLGFFDMYFLALSRVSDHFEYLPLITLVALMAGGLSLALHGRVLAIVGGTLVICLAVLAALRAPVFVSEELLWRDTLKRNPAAWCAHANLGWILASQQKYDEARAHLEASLAVHPDNAQAHSNLGRILSLQGKFAEADVHLQAALKIKPHDAEIRKSYASALAEQGRRDEAMAQFREALRLHSDSDSRIQLATLLVQAGKPGEAVAEYRQVLAVKPYQPDVLNNLAWLLATCSDETVRNGAEALRLAEHACRLNGFGDAQTLGTLAAAYAEAGRFTEAADTARKAIELARAGGNTQLAAVGGQLLKLFRAGKAYHEPPPTASPPSAP